MSVDITHHVGSHASIAHRVAHHAEAAFVLGRGLSHVVSIAAHAITGDLRQNAGPALAGKFQFFEDQDARAFANDKTVTVFVPGTAGLLGLVVTRGESAHGSESAHAHGSDRGFGATGNHHVGVVVLDDAEG